jgi:hypothetical protein
VISKDVSAKEYSIRAWTFESIILYIQELNYEKNIYELEYHVGEKALNSNLSPKFGPTKRIPLKSFLNYLLKSVWVGSIFPYARLPPLREQSKTPLG